ncbi:transcriptional regulator [Ameyamaea chiangmaiensis NBRC 103196]|nr:transcriptional regulator [Ameyamaea chiangmaiensis NBRC 103196]
MRERILQGQLVPGQRLGSTRGLAQALGVARSTVVLAYDHLRAEGFLDTAPGAPTRVARLRPTPFPHAPTTAVSEPPQPYITQPSGQFRPGVPDLSAFPAPIWARCLGARTRGLRIHDLGYTEPAGLAELRAAIVEHAAASRGVLAQADQVLVLPSTAMAIDLLARLMQQHDQDRGHNRLRAWVEDPGYPVAQRLLRGAGAELIPVPVDAEGIDISRTPVGRPGLIYVSPSHQYPTGGTMSLPRRLALLDAAAQHGALILEDDYDSEFLYDDRPLACLQGIDRSERVAYLSTFSKVLAPGLRVAYAIVPRWLLGPALTLLQDTAGMVPVHTQAALADFMREGHLRAHVRRMRPVYAERMRVTAEALRAVCGAELDVGQGAVGLQLAAWFRDPAIDDTAIVRSLEERGVRLRALSALSIADPRPGLLIGIATATRSGAERLARLVLRLVEAQRPGHPG